MSVVLDAWAVLALLEGVEPASTRVQTVLDGTERTYMSWINLGEVFYVTRRRHGEREAIEAIRDLQGKVTAELPSQERILAAARLKAERALGFADTFAAATAIAHDAVLLTGDPELVVVDASWRVEDLRAEVD